MRSLKHLLIVFSVCIRGAFSKFQDYILNTTTVNCTFLTVMLLFNIFFLQFTAVFHRLEHVALKFLLASVEISGHNAVEHLYRF